MVRVMRLTGAMAVAIVLLKHAEAGSMRAAGGYSAPAPGPGDVDCVLGEWVLKHDCDPKTLVQVFEREVLTKPEGKGRKCDRTIEKRQCLPVHCQMGPWSDWSVCDESGYKQRTREIEVSPKLGGRSCPSSTQRVKCRPEDCVMCAWSEWVCDEYTGIQTRRRHVTRPARDGGAPCPSDYEEKPCNPVPCVLGYGYGDWSDCDESGTRHKTQNIMTPAKFGGTCDPDVKSELCPFPCKRNTVDEETTNEWSKCVEQYDGTWMRSKELGIKTPAENGGTCPPETATETCEPVPCKRNTVDEETTNEWSKCVEQYDGTWVRSKELGIKTPAENGGTCPPETATETCEPVPCKRNTVDEETTNEWSKCVEQYDGTWVRSKELGIKTPAENGGTCPPETATETCEPVPCKRNTVDEETTNEWSKCVEQYDGTWMRSKELGIKTPAENGGTCPPETATETCEPVPCKRNTVDEETTNEWSKCVEQYDGTWVRSKELGIKTPAENGGTCPPETATETCEPVPCKRNTVDEETTNEWSKCVEQYDGTWVRSKELGIKTPAENGGTCPPETATETCEPVPCKRNTVDEETTNEWSKCVEQYDGTWVRSKELGIKTPAENGGTCPPETATETCEPVPCKRNTVDEETTNEWSKCVEQYDGTWVRSKELGIKTPAENGGTCPPETATETCEPVPCKRNTVDEETTNEWSKCVEQYDGTWVRSKELGIKTPAENGGTCPPETATETCEPVPCKRNTVDEETTNEWSKCVEQYDGTWVRSKELGIKTPAENGGTCPPETATETCEPVPCKRNTVDEETTNEWSKCVEQYDGTWVRSKELGIKTPAENGGTCPPETATETCAPVDCVMEGEFGKCEKKGHKWFKTKVLKVKVYPENGGKQCPPKDDCTITEECEKVDCVVSDFGPWGPCTKNWRKRTREVTQQPMYGGKACPKLEEKERCSDYVL